MKVISRLWTKKGSPETTLGFGPKKRQKTPSNALDERALTGTVSSHKVIRMAHGIAAYIAYMPLRSLEIMMPSSAKPMVETERISSLCRGSDDCAFRIELYMLPPL